VFLDFAGSSRHFRLRIGEAEELEQRCNAPIGAIMIRVASGQFAVADIWQTIRLGLVGGGLDEPRANALCKRYEHEPLYYHAHIPAAILKAFLMGVDAAEDRGTDEGNEDAAGSNSDPET
jgi:hypothetical protein